MMKSFSSGNYGHCLRNKPSINLLTRMGKVARYPGEYFDENKQCEFVFGNGAKICSYMPPCRRLWCTTSQGEEYGCRTQHMPWADGTPCGHNMWCIKSSCVLKADTTVEVVVDGGWGEWRNWSACSQSCGGGIREAHRDCDNPVPSGSGLYCIGDRVKYESCNTWKCLSSSDSRLEQCEAFNGNNFNMVGIANDVRWLPKYTGSMCVTIVVQITLILKLLHFTVRGSDRCKLFCRVQDSSAYFLLGTTVTDGTLCGPDTFDTCVNGQCIPAGCDHVLGSGVQLDWCGVCGGDNSTCHEERGFFNRTEYGYNEVVRIPAGATNIEIRQHGFRYNSKDDNYIALKDVDTDQYILNGDFVMSMFRKTIQYGAITLEYSGSDSIVERINSSMPLRKDLAVEVLTVGNLYPPQVYYRYVISKTSKDSYHWQTLSRWSHCDRICNGKQYSKPVCVQESTHMEVQEDLCSYLGPRPEVKSKDCNMHCELRWRVKSRTQCSAKCGSQGTWHISHECVRVMSNGQVVGLAEMFCLKDMKRPDPVGPCSGPPCHEPKAKWIYGQWTSCSVSCGGTGVQTRTAGCFIQDNKSVPDNKCKEKPEVSKSCGTNPCPKWRTGGWTNCNVSCGTGVRQRPYWCQVEEKKIDARYCSSESVPLHIQTCFPRPCASWQVGNWSECKCGVSERKYREVYCQDDRTGSKLTGHICNEHKMPKTEDSCDKLDCNVMFDPRINQVPRAPVETTTSTPRKTTFRWKVGPWKNCSKSCGGGFKGRAVTCFNTALNIPTTDGQCSLYSWKPKVRNTCNHQDCGKWLKGLWSACSVSCDKGIQGRLVSCVSKETGQLLQDKACDPLRKPGVERICPDNPECHHEVPQMSDVEESLHSAWEKGVWSECSKTCGEGVKQRMVICRNRDKTDCDPWKRPVEQMPCNTDPCPRWNFGEWGKVGVSSLDI